MSQFAETAETVRSVHASALARGQPAHVAFEIAAETCRRTNPGLTAPAAERLALAFLRECAAG